MGFPSAGVLCVILKAFEVEALCKMVASSFILHNFHHLREEAVLHMCMSPTDLHNFYLLCSKQVLHLLSLAANLHNFRSLYRRKVLHPLFMARGFAQLCPLALQKVVHQLPPLINLHNHHINFRCCIHNKNACMYDFAQAGIPLIRYTVGSSFFNSSSTITPFSMISLPSK